MVFVWVAVGQDKVGLFPLIAVKLQPFTFSLIGEEKSSPPANTPGGNSVDGEEPLMWAPGRPLLARSG